MVIKVTEITIDPVTRVEGHLKITAKVDDKEVKDVECSGVLFRGFEVFLKDRDPRDAQRLTQRICGVCPSAHATAAALALDNAFGIENQITDNGRIIRNLILGCNFLQSHILHFYHLAALDYVDVTAAGGYAGHDPDLQSLRKFLARKHLEPFFPRYEGDYRLSRKQNQKACAHYVQALRVRRKAHEILCVFGGKMPHSMAIVPGGVTTTPSADKITSFLSGLNEIRRFIDNVYLPDILMIARTYDDYFAIGKGADRFLSYGVFDLEARCGTPVDRSCFLPQGVMDSSLNRADTDLAKITEEVTHSWYDDQGGNTHPSREKTTPLRGKKQACSWVKSPRYQGKVTEVGPLSRMLAAYVSDHNGAKNIINSVLSEVGAQPSDLLSVCGRHAARAIEAKLIADAMAEWVLQVKPGVPVCVDYQLPDQAEGVGITDAPRGALGHWIKIADKKIANYQLVAPTTWNASPKDAGNNPGPMEQAILGTRVQDENNPYEIVRILRSFDPCLACAVHAVDVKGRNLREYKIS